MNGGRAERNEYILLHEFHRLKYICPDKTWGKKSAVAMKAEAEDGDGFNHPTRPEPPLPNTLAMQRATHALLHGSSAQLGSHNKAELWYLCAERGLRRVSTKARMLRELSNWVRIALAE